MNCAWCSPSNNGTDGICDDCMRRHFGIDPASIHEEMEASQQTVKTSTEEQELSEVQA